MRAGDTVWHVFAEEEWILGRAKGEYVYPMGWPRSRAAASDCVLLIPATEAEHLSDKAAYERSYGPA